MKRRGVLVTLLLVIPALFACNKKPDNPDPPEPEPIVVTYNSVTFDNGDETKVFDIPDGTAFKEILKDYNPSNKNQIKHWTIDNNPVAYGYEVTSDIVLEPAFIDSKSLYFTTPEDNSVVGYAHTALPYVAPPGSNIDVDYPEDAIKCDVDNVRNAIQITALPDVNEDVTVTIKDAVSGLQDSIKLNVHCPNNINEVGLAFDFALADHETSFKTKFNFSNDVSLNDFTNAYVETRTLANVSGLSTFGRNGCDLYYSYFNDMATEKGGCEGSDYYLVNMKNAAYENRKAIAPEPTTKYPFENRVKTLKVNNSESLFFALEHGFYPIVSSGTNASQILEKAKTAYASCVQKTEYWTIRTLYEWLIDNTHYDYWVVSNEPTLSWPYYMSYFAEGVFLNEGIAVCDGFSKAFVILAGIGDLPVIRGSGFTESKSGHAWNYYCADDYLWYLICPTWGHSDFKQNHLSFANYHPFLAEVDYFYYYVYDSIYNQAIEEGLSQSEAERQASTTASEYYYKETIFPNISRSPKYYSQSPYLNDYFTVNGKKYDYDITSEEELQALFEFMKQTATVPNVFYSIDLTYESLYWLQKSSNGVGYGYTADYSYYNCTIYFLKQ